MSKQSTGEKLINAKVNATAEWDRLQETSTIPILWETVNCSHTNHVATTTSILESHRKKTFYNRELLQRLLPWRHQELNQAEINYRHQSHIDGGGGKYSEIKHKFKNNWKKQSTQMRWDQKSNSGNIIKYGSVTSPKECTGSPSYGSKPSWSLWNTRQGIQKVDY